MSFGRKGGLTTPTPLVSRKNGPEGGSGGGGGVGSFFTVTFRRNHKYTTEYCPKFKNRCT